jgi:cyclic pyranopterin phosphate synthase
MVDISEKPIVSRSAEAMGRIYLGKETIEAIKGGKVKKGDPIAVAEIASIQAAKKTSELIPMCHQISLTSIESLFEVRSDYVEVKCKVTADYKTGVEMEALTGASMALLTVWDMVKYLEKNQEGQYPTTKISDIVVTEKVKGK